MEFWNKCLLGGGGREGVDRITEGMNMILCKTMACVEDGGKCASRFLSTVFIYFIFEIRFIVCLHPLWVITDCSMYREGKRSKKEAKANLPPSGLSTRGEERVQCTSPGSHLSRSSPPTVASIIPIPKGVRKARQHQGLVIEQSGGTRLAGNV